MKYLLLLSFLTFALAGCVTTRTSLPPNEAHYHFVIHHHQSRQQAFNNVELALAQEYNDLPRVLALKQPETGTYLLKPLVSYSMNGSGLDNDFAGYTLKIVVQNATVLVDIDLGTDEQYPGIYPPESEIPMIREKFGFLASKVATAVGGTVQ